jgi:hypothetical protein
LAQPFAGDETGLKRLCKRPEVAQLRVSFRSRSRYERLQR